MDLNEMRRKYREEKARADNGASITHQPAISKDIQQDNRPKKRGESSSVTLSEMAYEYSGYKTVTFKCKRLDNASSERTGLLTLCCWISEFPRENSEWRNDNYALVGSVEYGALEVGYGFPDINYTFEIPDRLQEVIEQMNNDSSEWHFVFTVNELDEDGNNYIIHDANCPNENNATVSINDKALTVALNADEDERFYYDGKLFSGIIFSSDQRVGMECKDGESVFYYGYHPNDKLALAVSLQEDDVNGECYNTDGERITEESFEALYKEDFESVISKFEEELDSLIERQTSSNDGISEQIIYDKVKSITASKLVVPLYQISENTAFVDDLGADSLDLVELAMELEKAFNIVIPDEEVANKLRTVGDAVRYLKGKIQS